MFGNNDWEKSLDKLGINFEKYDMEDLRVLNMKSALEMANRLSNAKFFTSVSFMSGNLYEAYSLEFYRAMLDQNFMLMRQNEEIIRLLEEVVENTKE